MWNCNNGGQRDQLSFRLALIRQLTAGRDTKRRSRSDFFTKSKPAVSGVPDDVRLREVGKYLPFRTRRRRCRQCGTTKHEARTNMMCSYRNVPLCIHPCFEKFHRKYLRSYKKVFNIKCVFRLPLQLLSEKFFIIRRNERDIDQKLIFS
jgi:hypothetical protein